MKNLKYKVLKTFLSEEELSFYIQEFQKIPINKMAKDNYGPSIYNFPVFLEILCNKLHVISSVINEPLLPTYCYARKYQKDTILHEHIDRPSCEVSVTLHLYGDMPWTFYLKDEGKEIGIDLDPGDAIYYSGTELPHWRNQYLGNEYAQVFLHYVRSRGKFNDYYFDRKQPPDREKLLKWSNKNKKQD